LFFDINDINHISKILVIPIRNSLVRTDQKEDQIMIKKMIVATGLALLAGCATTGNIREDRMPARPTESVTETSEGYTSVACARNYGDFNLAKAEAEALAQSAIIAHTGASEGRLVGCTFDEYMYLPDAINPKEICVEVSVPYAGVRE